MAKYIVLDSKFNPTSFKDMIAPYQEYFQRMDKMQEKNEELELATEQAKWMFDQAYAGEQTNPWLEYNKQLEEYADYASKPIDVQDYINKGTSLRKQYVRDIEKMNTAYKLYLADKEQREKETEQDPTRVYNDQKDFNLRTYYDNLNHSVESVSGKHLASNIANKAKTKSGAYRSNTTRNISGDPSNKLLIQYFGENPNDVLDVENAVIKWSQNPTEPIVFSGNNNKAKQDLATIILNEVKDYKDWNPESFQKLVRDAVVGIYDAIGQDKTQIIANQGYNANPNNTETTTYPAINPRNIYSQVEQDDRINKYDKYKQYVKVNPDGTYELTTAGKEEYSKGVNYTPSTEEWQGNQVIGDTPFKIFIDSLTEEYKKTEAYKEKHPDNSTPSSSEVLSEMWPSYIEAPRYDALRETEFAYDFDSKDAVDIKNKIKHGASGMDLKVVDYNKDKGVYTSTGETLKSTDFAKDRYTVVSMASSSKGTIIDLYDEEKGKNLKIKLPQGTHSYAQDSLNRVWYSIDDIQKNLSKQDGEKIVYKNKEITLTQDVRDILQEDYEKLLANAYFYMGQIFGTNTTQTQEFEQNAF